MILGMFLAQLTLGFAQQAPAPEYCANAKADAALEDTWRQCVSEFRRAHSDAVIKYNNAFLDPLNTGKDARFAGKHARPSADWCATRDHARQVLASWVEIKLTQGKGGHEKAIQHARAVGRAQIKAMQAFVSGMDKASDSRAFGMKSADVYQQVHNQYLRDSEKAGEVAVGFSGALNAQQLNQLRETSANFRNAGALHMLGWKAAMSFSDEKLDQYLSEVMQVGGCVESKKPKLYWGAGAFVKNYPGLFSVQKTAKIVPGALAPPPAGP